MEYSESGFGFGEDRGTWVKIDCRIPDHNYHLNFLSTSFYPEKQQNFRDLASDLFASLCVFAVRFCLALEQADDLAVCRQVDLGGGGDFGQARHGHDVAAHHDDEFRTGGEPDFADVDGVAGRCAAGGSIR